MKFSVCLALQRTMLLLTCVCALNLLNGSTARAQKSVPARPTAQPQPTAPPPTKQSSYNAPAVQDSSALATPRERRAKAYAKLLEGQRYLSGARGAAGITRESLQSAQQSLQQAAELDPTLAEAHTALAEINFFFLDDLEEAQRETNKAISIDKDNLGAHRILSRILSLKAGLDEGKLDRAAASRAIAELREVTRLIPNDAEAWALLGELYLASGRDKEAIDALQNYAAAPSSIDTRFYQVVTQGRTLSPDAAQARLGEVFLKAGRSAEAIAAIRRAIEINPENGQYVQLLTQAVEAGGDDHGVIADLQRLSASNPANVSMIRLLAETQVRVNRVDDAVKTLRDAIAKRSDGEREQLLLVNELVQVLTEALRYDEAIAAYEGLLKSRGIGDKLLTSDVDKQYAAAFLERIINLQRQANRLDGAAATVERMRRLLGPDDASADFQYIQLLNEQGKRKEALEAVRAARLKHPEQQADFLRLEADTLSKMGNVDEAATLLRTQLTGKPEDDYTTQLNIANLYLEAGRGKESGEAARKALDLAAPGDSLKIMQALVMLSSAQERAGDMKGAEESLRRVLVKDPNNAVVLNNLGYFLADHNDRLPEALDMIKRAVKAEPNNPSFLDSLGWVYFKLGQLDDAERYLTEAARHNGRSVAIQEHLGDLYQKRGKSDLAKIAWRKALSLSSDATEIARLKIKLGGSK